MAKRFLVVINVFVFILVGILTIALLGGKETNQVLAQCTPPSTPTNVLVEFPSCTGDTCNFTEASCSWTEVSGATSYNVVVTEVESGTVVTTQQPAAGTTSLVFAVTQNRTYQCDVSAVNTCGTSTAASHSLFCEVDALVESTPTVIPPTQPPVEIPTKAPIPTVGIVSDSIIIGLSGIAILALGVFFFVL